MKRMTDEQVDEIVGRYARGQGFGFIAYALGIGRDRVRAALVSRGVKLRRFGRRTTQSWGWTGRGS